MTILGCGPSYGVPSAGDPQGPYWGECNPHDPRNARLRASVYVEFQGLNILVDTSPDLRQQLLQNHIHNIDAVLISHFHADHVHGIDDLRHLALKQGYALPLYADKFTLEALQQSFSYLFTTRKDGLYKQILETNLLNEEVVIQSRTMQCFEQGHGPARSRGFLFGNMAYSTDFNYLDDKAIAMLKNLDVWIVDCLGRTPKPTHNNLDLTLQWIARVQPKRAILTHMGPELDYETLRKELPDFIEPAYDGMVIEFP